MSIDFSNLPELPFDDLTYAVDLFDGFDHSKEPTSISAAHDFGQASSGHQTPVETVEGSIPEVSTNAGRATTSDHRQHLNKLAQKRFRERQRVCQAETFIKTVRHFYSKQQRRVCGVGASVNNRGTT